MRSCLQVALVSMALFLGAGLVAATAKVTMQVGGIDLSADTPLIPLTTVPAERVIPNPPVMAHAQLSVSESMRIFDNLSADDSAEPGPADDLSPTVPSNDADPTEPQVAVEVHTTSACNLRAGLGTTFEIVGTCNAGDTFKLIAKNKAADWYELADGAWIAAFLVANAPSDLPLSTNTQQ